MAGPLCAEGGVCIFRVLFLEDPGPEGQDMSPQRQEEPSLMSVSVLTMAGMEPALEAEGGGRGEGASLSLSSPSQARIFHRLTFSAWGCPQRIQSMLDEASRREEGSEALRWSWTDGGGGCSLPLLWNVCAIL